LTIAYQLTFEDFREVSTGVTPAAGGRKPWRTAGWVVFIFLVTLLFFLLNSSSRRGGAAPPVRHLPLSPYGQLAAAVLPSAFFFVLFGIVLLRTMVRPVPRPWEIPSGATASAARKRKATRGLFGWVLFVGLAVIMFLLLQPRTRNVVGLPPPGAGGGGPAGAYVVEEEADTRSLSMGDFLPAIVPWVGMFLLLVVVTKFAGERQLRKTWDAQPSLHRPQTVELSDDGVMFADPLSRQECRWSYFPGFKETANLFVLYVSPFSFRIVPKRAFAAPGELDRFRGYLLNHVGSGQFLEQPSAFPVLPVAAAAARPAEPSPASPPPLPPAAAR
jgi:hypothetical protein